MVGGWTEPRQTRQYFGALLLGRVPTTATADRDCRLTYVGHTGTGFNGRSSTRVWKLLKPREIRESPFSTPSRPTSVAHWVRPELVAQVRFTEWTADNKLRHPVYLGLRDDKEPRTVVREETGSGCNRSRDERSGGNPQAQGRPARGAALASRLPCEDCGAEAAVPRISSR